MRHEARLIAPAYVNPYVKRETADAAYAEAICEAETRPTIWFVTVKTVVQQAVLMLHKSRDRRYGKGRCSSTCFEGTKLSTAS